MSLFYASNSRGPDQNQPDHAITLVDHTKSEAPAPDPDVDPQNVSPQSPSGASTPTEGGRDRGLTLTQRLTGGSLREELTKRKYRKWQQDRFEGDADDDGPQTGTPSTPLSPNAPTLTKDSAVSKAPTTDEVDFGTQQPVKRQTTEERGRLRDLGKKITGHFHGAKHSTHKKRAESEVDILYENQRGWFIFGIPLYSQKSLLNLDPAPWTNGEYKDSAVNIMNAQVPDPTWEWAWKRWYVDMSYDVDEEGWQYSLGFTRYSWHGTHPWFHNFVRRRRWLRRRVKRASPHKLREGSMQQAHMLRSDYFTIHGSTTRSRGTSVDRTTNGQSSRNSTKGDEDIVDTDEIKDIPALMKVLHHGSVDREKIDAVKHFIQQGGEEIHYLEEQIPRIMSLFVFQNSRRQLLSYLLKTVSDARAHRAEHTSSNIPESESEKRRIDDLVKSVRAADEEIRNLEFWSDVKKVEKGAKGEEKIRLSRGTSGEEGLVGQIEDMTPGVEGDKGLGSPKKGEFEEEMKGIPDNAGLEPEGLKAVFESGGPERDAGLNATDVDEISKGEEKKDERKAKWNEKGKEKAVGEVDEDSNDVPFPNPNLSPASGTSSRDRKRLASIGQSSWDN